MKGKSKQNRTHVQKKRTDQFKMNEIQHISDKQNLRINVTLKIKKLKRSAASKGKCA